MTRSEYVLKPFNCCGDLFLCRDFYKIVSDFLKGNPIFFPRFQMHLYALWFTGIAISQMNVAV